MAEKQYVVFKLNTEEFGISITDVKEIIPYQGTVNIPNSPNFIEGVINYRGNVIPIINLKERFKLKSTEVNKDTRIIVINIKDKEIGFIVDEASRTMRMNEEKIDPAPDIVLEVDKRYITGIGKMEEGGLLILLDLHKILTEKEKDQISMIEI